MKNLFSESLSNKKWAIIITSFIAFIALIGFITFETTKNTVALTIDGQEKTVKTHASTVRELFEEQDILLQKEDYVSPTEDSKVTNNLKIVWEPAKQVQLSKENGKESIWTTSKTVKDFLKEQSIVLNEHDEVQPSLNTALKKGMDITVKRAVPLTLLDGGVEKETWSTSTTVADFLTQQGVSLTELDRVEPALEDKVMENGTINVIRVEKVTDVVEEPISYAIVTNKDENLDTGTEKVITEGQEGLISKEYEVTLENGKEVSRVVLNEKKLKDKQDKVVSVGTKLEPIQVASRGSGNGKEIYVTSTAYTASCNGCSGTTATGVNLHANPNAKVIAVDPRVIPLGSKVYVDGYGYAIASDTGGAIKGNKIDVFFPSKSDAYRWGRKTVKIKILD
ncbi:MAG TPA: ubiquitin-like domain-containing protein [Bacillus sp. (in: firmicutes)]